MYSFASVPDGFTGLAAVVILFGAVSLFVSGCSIFSDFKVAAFYAVLGGSLITIALLLPKEHHKNEQIVATRIEFSSSVEKTGKSSYGPVGYVAYQTPEGQVLFKIVTGSVYPDRVYLYKN